MSFLTELIAGALLCSYKDFAPAEPGVVRGIISSTLKQLTGRAETPRDGSHLAPLNITKTKLANVLTMQHYCVLLWHQRSILLRS
jgi:hypothetical protein